MITHDHVFNIHVCVCMFMRVLLYTHTLSHTHIHSHTQTHAHTHTRTHIHKQLTSSDWVGAAVTFERITRELPAFTGAFVGLGEVKYSYMYLHMCVYICIYIFECITREFPAFTAAFVSLGEVKPSNVCCMRVYEYLYIVLSASLASFPPLWPLSWVSAGFCMEILKSQLYNYLY